MEKINVYCPKCKEVVAKRDIESNMNGKYKCRNCNKLVVFDYKTWKTTLQNVPRRVTNSGMRFW